MTDITETSTEMADPGEALFSAGVADNPTDTYRDLRQRCPVARSTAPDMPSVYLFDYENVSWALRHPEVFSSEGEVLSIGQEQPLIPVQVDPPQHTGYRRLLNRSFTPKRMTELEPDVRTLVGGLLDSFVDSGACDFHEQFATPLPSTIFLRLMGMPQEDLPTFLGWRDDSVRPAVEPGDFEGAAAIRASAGKAISEYFQTAIDTARVAPGDGLISELVDADFEGRPFDTDELLGICHLMLLGGLDTVTATLDCMIVYLAQHPERRRQLVDDPSLIPVAIEELLRHQTPVMLVPRIVKTGLTMSGVELHPGEPAMLVIGAANGDETVFDDPEEVDYSRDLNRHLAFGGGNHKCLGAHLARLELRVALEEFHHRIPDYRLADGAEIHFSPGIRQPDRLPLVWD